MLKGEVTGMVASTELLHAEAPLALARSRGSASAERELAVAVVLQRGSMADLEAAREANTASDGR